MLFLLDTAIAIAVLCLHELQEVSTDVSTDLLNETSMTHRVLTIKSRLQALGRSQNWAERRLRYSSGYLSRVFSGDRTSKKALGRLVTLIEREEARRA